MNEPRQSSRRASDMSLEQLYRKRAIDRENQRNLRHRNKGRIFQLEAELEMVRGELEASQNRESSLEQQLSAGRTRLFSVIDTLQCLASTELMTAATSFDNQVTPPSTHHDSILASASSFPCTGAEEIDADFWTHGGSLTFPIDGTTACDLSDFCLDLEILAPHADTPFTFPNCLSSSGDAFGGSTVSQYGVSPTNAYPDREDFSAARMAANTLGRESPIWSVVPRYTPPTTSIDELIINLIETRKLNYGQDAGLREFSYKNFPSVSSLLNPSAVEPDEPVASTIAKHVVGVIRVHTLPEKLALLYIMCVLIRWQVCPSQEHYDAIPEFCRPTGSQITVPHPPWIETIGWSGFLSLLEFFD